MQKGWVGFAGLLSLWGTNKMVCQGLPRVSPNKSAQASNVANVCKKGMEGEERLGGHNSFAVLLLGRLCQWESRRLVGKLLECY